MEDNLKNWGRDLTSLIYYSRIILEVLILIMCERSSMHGSQRKSLELSLTNYYLLIHLASVIKSSLLNIRARKDIHNGARTNLFNLLLVQKSVV